MAATKNPLSSIIIHFLSFAIIVDANSRCGTPELPPLVQMVEIGHGQSPGYFEHLQSVSVTCRDGLVAILDNRTGLVSIRSEATIQCQDGNWNNSGNILLCLDTFHPENIKIMEPINSSENFPIGTIEDNLLKQQQNCIRLDRNNLKQKNNLTWIIKFNPNPRSIPRLAMILRNHIDLNQTIITALQNLFAHFQNRPVVSNTNQSRSSNKTGLLLNLADWRTMFNGTRMEDSKSNNLNKNRSEIIIQTSFAELHVQIEIGDIDDQWHNCYFDQNLEVAPHATNATANSLFWNCPVIAKPVNGVRFRVGVYPISEKNNDSEEEIRNGDWIELCGLELLSVAIPENFDDQCGEPSIPVYGLVERIRENGQLLARYGCTAGYRLTTVENLRYPDQQKTPKTDRICDPKTGRWSNTGQELLCVPQYWCRSPPPLPSSGNDGKFLFEFSRLDQMNRAVSDVTMATLRCSMVTQTVIPITVYRCDRSGRWILLGGGSNEKNESEIIEPSSIGNDGQATEPECINIKFRSRGYRHYYYHHHFPTESTINRHTKLFGHRLDDNKYLTYYGAAGVAFLFIGSFVTLIHVRRMAKKMSRQMREQAYLNAEKGGPISDAFLAMSDASADINGSDGMEPPGYYDDDGGGAFFDIGTGTGGTGGGTGGTLYSRDLPPPATPISMPSALSGSNPKKSGTKNLSSNFDSIKF